MPGPYRVVVGEVGGIGKVRGWTVGWAVTARVTAGENICLRNVRKSFILIL